MLIQAILNLSHTIKHQKLPKMHTRKLLGSMNYQKTTHYKGHYQSIPPAISIYSNRTLVNQLGEY